MLKATESILCDLSSESTERVSQLFAWLDFRTFDSSVKVKVFIFRSSRSEGVFEDIFSYFSSKPYVVTPYLNRLVETVQMRGHDICFFMQN